MSGHSFKSICQSYVKELRSRQSEFRECGVQLQAWLPVIPASWYSCLWVIPSLCKIAGPGDLLLINRIWQRCWNDTSVIKLQKSCDFPLAVILYCLFDLQLWSNKLSCCRGPCGEELRDAYGQELVRIWVLQSCARNWLLPTTIQVSLEADSFPAELSQLSGEWQSPHW